MNLGDNILKLRKKNKLSQENLAEAIGVTRQTISNWELGETSPNYEQLKLLSKALNIDVDIFLKNESSPVSLKAIKNSRIKNIIIVIMAIIICILVGILLYLFIDSKNYTKFYHTTKNTTTEVTSQPSNSRSTFIRTYKVEDINKVICMPDIVGCDDTTFDVTLSKYKGEKVKIQLSNSELFKKLEATKTYEFEFRMPGEIALEKDNIQSIFAFAILVSINETNKSGNNQIQEPIIY